MTVCHKTKISGNAWQSKVVLQQDGAVPASLG